MPAEKWPNGIRPAEDAFVVTVGVRRAHKQLDCDQALTAIHRARFHAGPTSDDALMAMVVQNLQNAAIARGDEALADLALEVDHARAVLAVPDGG